ncbi:unnamed protein product [Ambrosiozyma monospora]|uniref:Histone chaperone ASF1 n=1 Tax=Ambrosiozyma monospora TaxID=43982 RepID=A0A9W6Z3D6_AMBMO|nr:unnamed protein product [Ambrosiozyma monospora]
MSIVSLLGINVLNNPARFTDPYQFEITFECLEPLKEDLEWKLTYVGSSRSLEHDQELDSILVGPVPVGINKFILTADAPSPELIPASELVSVTVILLSCSYKEREFVRVGYYVNNEYDSEELRENPPSKVQVDHIVRNILAEKPRVTRFNIVWDNENENADEYPPDTLDDEEPEDDDEDQYAEDEYEQEEVEEDDTGKVEPVEQEPEHDKESKTKDHEKPADDEGENDEPVTKKRKLEGAEVEEEEEEEEDVEEDLDALEEEDEAEAEAEAEEEEEELEEEEAEAEAETDAEAEDENEAGEDEKEGTETVEEKDATEGDESTIPTPTDSAANADDQAE